MYGGRGRDFISPNAGDDIVYGGRGADRITLADQIGEKHALNGKDDVFAGSGDDRVGLLVDGQHDSVDCGPGNDVVTYFVEADQPPDPTDDLTNCETVEIEVDDE